MAGFLDPDQISTMDISGRGSLSSDWTDEKHSMYLKSMEASFVDQLYSSMNSSAWHKRHHSRLRPSDQTDPNEFQVHQSGSWKSINFGKGEPSPQELDECRFRQGNQLIHHYRTDIRKYDIVRGSTSDGSPIVNSGTRKSNSSVGQEFSDQNFDEEDNKEAVSDIHATKRVKIAKSTSNKFQDIPFGQTRCLDLSLHSSSEDGQIGKDWKTCKSKTTGSH